MTMAEEVLRVEFEMPEEFEDEVQFIPTGIPGYMRIPKLGQYKRILVMSPFVSPGILQGLLAIGTENIAISRAESLDELNPRTLRKLKGNTRFFFMENEAERPEEGYEEHDIEEPTLTDLTGLHAKLIIAEDGSKADVLTGSANATNAAFSGRNIEFVVKLSGRRGKVGINALLGSEDSKVALQSMLREYERDGSSPKPDDALKVMEDAPLTSTLFGCLNLQGR
jgi:hypothetical protein